MLGVDGRVGVLIIESVASLGREPPFKEAVVFFGQINIFHLFDWSLHEPLLLLSGDVPLSLFGISQHILEVVVVLCKTGGLLADQELLVTVVF